MNILKVPAHLKAYRAVYPRQKLLQAFHSNLELCVSLFKSLCYYNEEMFHYIKFHFCINIDFIIRSVHMEKYSGPTPPEREVFQSS